MDRREFLVGTGVGLGLSGAAARLLSGCGAAVGAPEAGPGAGPWAWPAVKAEFALAPDLVHMAGFFLASHPRAVREAVDTHRRGLDDNPIEYLEENVVRLETALRRAAADYFGASPDDFAITDSTTMGLGIVYGGLRLRAGQEILTTTHDHIVTTLALTYQAERSGAVLRQVPLYDDPARASADAIVEAFERSLTPATRVVAVTWVHSGTGVKLPIRRLADALARANASRSPDDRALLFVDGVHGFGLENESADSLGCDFLIAGTHKWIFGPRGTGLVWGRPGAWPITSPTIPSMDPLWRPGEPEQMPPTAFMTPGGFKSFEHRWSVEPAFRFHLAIGKDRVAARIHELNRMCKEGMAKLPGVRVKTPMAEELSAGIICFAVDGKTPHQVVARLRERGVVASTTPGFYTPEYARLAPSLLTLETDVDSALAALRAIA